jgi:hypothetical protein
VFSLVANQEFQIFLFIWGTNAVSVLSPDFTSRIFFKICEHQPQSNHDNCQWVSSAITSN